MKSVSVNIDNESCRPQEELVARCMKGDQKAQFQICKLYYRMMFVTSFWIVNDPLLVEKIVQDSFLVAFDHIREYDGKTSFASWLESIVIKRSLETDNHNRPDTGGSDENYSEEKLIDIIEKKENLFINSLFRTE